MDLHVPASLSDARNGAVRRARVDTRCVRLGLRRFAFAALTLGTIAAASIRAFDVLCANGLTAIEAILLPLFVVLMLPVALSFWLAVFGFVAVLRRRDALSPVNDLEADCGALPAGARTALVFPVHNEDPARVAAGIRATCESLAAVCRERPIERFAVFVLSDTTEASVWIDEEIEYDALRADLEPLIAVHYRKRRKNTAAKAGNIAEFCDRHGDEWRYMVVFDADSVMSGSCLVDLVRLMELHPGAGIIQVPPVPVNRHTLFGRLQQFSARAYGPLFQAGLSTVQCGEGNYYGHNAILRVAPFRDHCRLPTVPGDGPLSGHVLSHDFIEAAFMRRAGFRVFLAHELEGSYEEPPPTLIDYAARDRRWCHGNLQHGRLLSTSGLNPISRVHLFMGMMAYLSSPLWVVLLVATTVEALRERLRDHQYFAEAGALFPTWRVDTHADTALLFAAVMALLFAPKLLALLSRLLDERDVRRFGGTGALVGSVALETAFSMLIAPVLAFLQTRFVLITLLGSRARWTAQERNDVGTPLAEAARRHWGLTLIGVAWGAVAWRWVPDLFLWLSPVIAGLVLSIPLSALSSRASLGRRFARAGLLLTPEETHPPEVLRRLRAHLRAPGRSNGVPRGALERVLADPAVRALHLAMLPVQDGDALAMHRCEGIELKVRIEGPGALTEVEVHDLLLSRTSIERLAAINARSASGASE